MCPFKLGGATASVSSAVEIPYFGNADHYLAKVAECPSNCLGARTTISRCRIELELPLDALEQGRNVPSRLLAELAEDGPEDSLEKLLSGADRLRWVIMD